MRHPVDDPIPPLNDWLRADWADRSMPDDDGERPDPDEPCPYDDLDLDPPLPVAPGPRGDWRRRRATPLSQVRADWAAAQDRPQRREPA